MFSPVVEVFDKILEYIETTGRTLESIESRLSSIEDHLGDQNQPPEKKDDTPETEASSPDPQKDVTSPTVVVSGSQRDFPPVTFVTPEDLTPREADLLKGLQGVACPGDEGYPEIQGLSNPALAQRVRPYMGPITRGSLSATLTRLRRKGVVDILWKEEDPQTRIIRIVSPFSPEIFEA